VKLKLIINTDGACKGNPGPGGYAAILQYREKELEVVGFDPDTTNNGMELKAVIEAIRKLNKPCDILVKSDSYYVCTGIVNVSKWEKNGWKLASGAAPKNLELWKEFQLLTNKGGHTVHYQYIKGHYGDPMNERCDRLAKAQIELHLKGE